jgi:hypothetical protein
VVAIVAGRIVVGHIAAELEVASRMIAEVVVVRIEVADRIAVVEAAIAQHIDAKVAARTVAVAIGLNSSPTENSCSQEAEVVGSLGTVEEIVIELQTEILHHSFCYYYVQHQA